MDRRGFVGFLLTIFGGLSSLMLLSVSPIDARSQLFFAIVGLCAYGVTQLVPRRAYRMSVIPMFGVVGIFLFLTLVLGHTAKGASRWITVGPVRFQASELAKPVLALTLCTVVTRFGLKSQKRLAFFFLLAGCFVIPVLLQPDLGSSLVLLALTVGICFHAIPKISLLVPWAILAIGLALVAWNFVLYPYQKERLFSFIRSSDQLGTGYNARQAVITVGSGKVWGRGIGHGVQTNLRFLPEHHTDFFFAAYAEETGFIGVCLLIGLYLTLFGSLLWRSNSLDGFDRLLRFGTLVMLLFQTFVHIYMNIGLSPVTGIPLPFLSSGGSSFVSLAILLGLTMRFHREKSDLRRTFGLNALESYDGFALS